MRILNKDLIMDWTNYECEGQIELEDYLWDLYFATCMNPPVEEVEDAKEDR